jgi:small subunit ribosomal protein S16
MVTIRLARGGSKKHPFYHINVADQRARRNGRYIERIGFYNPLATGQEEPLRIDLERAQYWLNQGAQASERVSALISRCRRAQKETTAAA